MTKWTPEAIRALGPTTDLPTLAAIVECSRWKSYQMAQHGEWERIGIKVLSIGSKYRVVVQSILDVLGYGSADIDGTTDERHSPRSTSERVAPFLSGHMPDHPGPDGPLRTSLGRTSTRFLSSSGQGRNRPACHAVRKAFHHLPNSLIAHRELTWPAYQIGSFSLVQLGPKHCNGMRIQGNPQIVESPSRTPRPGKFFTDICYEFSTRPEIEFIMVR